MSAMMALAVPAYRMFPNQFRGNGLPTLLLTTIGAKTGKRRTALLGYLHAGADSWLVIASMGGAASHPSWYLNLAKHSDKAWVEIAKRRSRVRAESLNGPDREEAWLRIEKEAPGYAAYREETDRQIPLVRLTAVD